MANRSPSGFLTRASDGAEINALGGITATFNSSWMTLVDPGDTIGLYVKNTNTGGTAVTLVPTLECSPDGGTTVIPFPDGYNSQTQAVMADAAEDDDDGVGFEYWPQPFPGLAGWSWRVVFTYGGTEGTNVLTAKRVHRGDGEDN